jgi:hypothetical protein
MKKLDENERHDLVVDIITGLMQGGYLSGNATSLEGGVKMCESLVEIIGEHFPAKKERKRKGASDKILEKARKAAKIVREEKSKKYHQKVLVQMEVSRQTLIQDGLTPSWRNVADKMNKSGFRTREGKLFYGSTLTPIASKAGWTLENGQNLSSTKP